MVFGRWLYQEGRAFPPPLWKNTASKWPSTYWTSSLQNCEKYISVFKPASLWYFCYHSPSRLRQWCYFSVWAMGSPPKHTHTHTHTHTRLSPVVQTPTYINHRRPKWDVWHLTRGFSVPLVKPRKAILRRPGLCFDSVIFQAGELFPNKSGGNSVTLTFKARLHQALEMW